MKKTQSPLTNRFYIHYKETICYDLLLKQNIENILEIFKLEKIILNTTSKVIVSDKKNIIPGLVALELFSGQNQKITSATKSISGFKLRESQVIGCKVTLRGETMFNFFEKLVTIILPRIRHFNAIDLNLFDGKGNLSLGLSSLLIVPELENYFEYFESIRGINISLITSLNNKQSSLQNYTPVALPVTARVGYQANHYVTPSTLSLLQNNKEIKQKIDKKAALLLTGFQLPVIQEN
jgi:large subunit ribosomal protein L5